MEQNNGFFYIREKEDGIYMHLCPENTLGKRIEVESVLNYLDAFHIVDYDRKVLKNAISTLEKECEIKISSQKLSYEIPEVINIEVSDDRMEALCRIYPSSDNSNILQIEDIKAALKKENIRYGVREAIIAELAKKKVYNQDVLIAKGLPSVNGKSAEIAYYFQTDQTKKPKYNEDGSVDFHQLDIINHVKKDQLLAELKPLNAGVPGIDVYGNIIRPLKVSNQVLRHGKNIYLSKDGLKMYAKVTGHVDIIGRKVFVSNTFEVLEDVDSSTGDINYDGNVYVRGNVRTGFVIHAQGDIIVDGVVEGAELYSQRHIILKRGIQGMNRGLLQANGNIISKFIESSTIKAGGYVDTEAILHSKIYAKTEVVVGGKKGFVTGGEIRAGNLIKLKTAGSTMGTTTILEVGSDPVLLDEYHACEVQISNLQEEKEKIIKVLATYKRKIKLGEQLSVEKVKYLQTLSKQNVEIEETLNPVLKRYEELQKEIDSEMDGKIIVQNKAYPGVRVCIGSCIYIVKSTEHHCKFIKKDVDVKVIGLG